MYILVLVNILYVQKPHDTLLVVRPNFYVHCKASLNSSSEWVQILSWCSSVNVPFATDFSMTESAEEFSRNAPWENVGLAAPM